MNATEGTGARVTGDWIAAGPVQAVCRVLTEAGHRALLVGGCVRNDLLGAPVADIDIATDARPEAVMQLAEAAGLKAIPTGIEHGTVTVVAEGQPHEITTFRRDVDTDGRHATVAFTDDVAADAARRDFTMNALYAEPDGQIIDPLDGLPDLRARRVRFVGDAGARLREDYLRALRFFRFHAWYGDAQAGLDPEALAAIAANLDGLPHLSVERITAEMLKLLAAPDPVPAVAAMAQAGVLTTLFGGGGIRTLGPLVHHEAALGLAPDPILRLAALGVPGIERHLRLSKAQAARLTLYVEAAPGTEGAAALGYRNGVDQALAILALRAALFETVPLENARQDAETGAAATFPLKAADLMPDLTGPALGAALKRAESDWIASGFALDKPALIARAKADPDAKG